MKTAEEIAFDVASAAIDMMALHSPHTEQMMRDAIERWKAWQLKHLRQNAPTIDEMVNRFLSWKLPESVLADLCACERTGCMRYGTNLLSANEAREMICHLMRPESQRKADERLMESRTVRKRT